MDLDLLFKILVIYIFVEKLLEALLSWANMSILKRKAQEVKKEILVSILLVMQLVWILALIYGAFFTDYKPDFTIAMVYLGLFIIGQVFKLTSILSFGREWSLHSSILLKDSKRSSGIYRILRHPHQIGGLLESFSLPCFAGFYLLGAVYGGAYLVIFILRLRFEEEVIFKYTDSTKAFSLKKSN